MDDAHFHSRKRLRLRNYDYSQGAGYFLTINVQDRRHIFGHIAEARSHLNVLGQAIADSWTAIEDRHQGVLVDEWIVMPNHMHGILVFTTLDPNLKLPSLIDVVRDFKSRTTRSYWDYVNAHGLTDWLSKLWQRSYYERVIRDEDDLYEKRNYIRTNPQRWELKRAGLL